MGRAAQGDEETHAAEVVVAILGGTTDPRHPGGGVPIRDLDLDRDDGRVTAVEVTRHNGQAELDQRAEIAREDPRSPTLRFNWHLGMGRTFDVRRVRHEAPTLLAALEQSGPESVHLNHSAETSEDPVLTELRLLGVRSLYHLGEADSNGGTLDIAIRLPVSRNENLTLALGHRPSR